MAKSSYRTPAKEKVSNLYSARRLRLALRNGYRFEVAQPLSGSTLDAAFQLGASLFQIGLPLPERIVLAHHQPQRENKEKVLQVRFLVDAKPYVCAYSEKLRTWSFTQEI